MKSRPSILLVDDTPVNLRTLGAALAADYDVKIATSGQMALQITAESPPDLIVLDIMMPEMDGYEVCRRIRADNGLKHIPVVFVTALKEAESELTGLELGAADYLTKPINVAIARKRISNLLEREALRTQVEVQRSELETKVAELSRTEEAQQLAAAVFSHMREGMLITDPYGRILDVNEALVELTGYRREEMLGNTPRMFRSGRQNSDFYESMWQCITEAHYWHGEIWNRRKNGNIFPVMLTINAVCDDQGLIRQYVALLLDISEIKNTEYTLQRMAHYDPLTQLPNRSLLSDRLQQAMALATRHDQRVAVCYLDVDGFKAVNDNYGHDVGDQLLITLGARLRECLRASDTLARIGGDEFVAVLTGFTDTASSISTFERLIQTASQPIHIGDIEIRVSASLGIAFFPQEVSADADQLLRQADQAMYQAKSSGKNRFRVFDELGVPGEVG
jgi:diguanylate cyclase (GGDEF)-like protein/PAS domain S-box-containing protein